jgi:trehalose-phosphatase
MTSLPTATQKRRASALASEGGRPVAAALLARHVVALVGDGRLLVVSDFDGTLSGLVSDPWGADMVPAARRALRRLAGAPGVEVVLLSGRTVLDLSGRARVGGIHYLGDHGAEWASASRGFRSAALRVQREPASPAEAATAQRLVREVPRVIEEAWLVVEDKGSALTFHFRTAPDIEAARTRLVAVVDAIDPDHALARSGGRRSLELRPSGATDKGTALLRLLAEHHPRAVVMLGDDHTDTLAFEALREARSRGSVDGVAIAVAGHADTRAGVAARADHVLASPREAARFLGLLADARRPGRSRS